MSKKSETIIEAILPFESADQAGSPSKLYGVVTGLLAGFDEAGAPMVDFHLNSSGNLLQARSIVPLSDGDSGREAILMFDGGEPTQPIIMGLVQQSPPSQTESRHIAIEADDERVVITAQKEIVLQCGKASITMTRAGKVLIRGAYLLSRSSGVNRIKGGSVQIN